MATAASITLITATQFGIANGSYDGTSTTFSSTKAKGDGYLGLPDGLHTVVYTPNNFVGTFNTQATLATNPTETDWTDVPGTSYGDGIAPLVTPFPVNFTGNYVWIRIVIDQFTSGSITKIQYLH